MYTLIVITPIPLKCYDTENISKQVESFFCVVFYILIAHSEMMNMLHVKFN